MIDPITQTILNEIFGRKKKQQSKDLLDDIIPQVKKLSAKNFPPDLKKFVQEWPVYVYKKFPKSREVQSKKKISLSDLDRSNLFKLEELVQYDYFRVDDEGPTKNPMANIKLVNDKYLYNFYDPTDYRVPRWWYSFKDKYIYLYSSWEDDGFYSQSNGKMWKPRPYKEWLKMWFKNALKKDSYGEPQLEYVGPERTV